MGFFDYLKSKLDEAKEARSFLDTYKDSNLYATTEEDWAKAAEARDTASPFYLKSMQVGYKDGLPVYTDDGLGNGFVYGWHYNYTPDGKLVKDYSEPSNNSGIGRITQGFLSGGLSEVAGDKFNKYAMPFLNPGAVAGKGVADSLKSGDWASAAQYMADPVTEPGIDLLARKSGEEIYKAVPEIKPYVKPVATTIASLYAPWAGLAAYELTNKMEGGSAQQGVVGGAAIGATAGLTSGISNYLGNLNAFGEGLAGASGAETTGYLARQAALNAASGAAANSMQTVSNADIANYLLSAGKDAAMPIAKLAAKLALQQKAIGALNNTLPSITYNQPSWSLGGLLGLTKAPSYVSDSSSSKTPSFTKTDLPTLSTYGDNKEKKIAEVLSNPYKNYTLNDYLLYKQDPDKIQDILARYT